MRGAWPIFALIFAIGTPAGVNAEAPGVKTLTEVGFATTADRIEFALTAEPPLDPASVSAQADGTVLMIRAEGTVAERRWLTTPDKQVNRTLLHPSRKNAPAAIVRSRLKTRVSKGMLEGIRVRVEGDTLVVAVPRSAKIAAGWAKAGQPAPAPTVGDAPFRLAIDTSATPAVPPALAAPAEPVEAAPAPIAGAPAAVVDPSVTAPSAPVDALSVGEDTPLAAMAAVDGEDAPLSAGLAQPAADGPGMGAYLMSLLFLGVVGVLMWRKMRGGQNNDAGRPIIRPVGSHMLGPKQNLLLVDVAGEMVLLGTSDKGVQMLTKIQSRDEHGSDEVTAGPAVPGEALPGQAGPVLTIAERLGSAVARFRSAAARIDRGSESTDETPAEQAERAAVKARFDEIQRATERRFFDRADDAVREAQEEDALAALVDRVEDTADLDRRSARRNFAPIERKAQAPVMPPPLDPSADLLRRIRALQRA